MWAPLQVEYCAYALEDAARSATYKLVQAFGQPLKAALAELSTKPAYGTAAEASALLSTFLSYSE